MDNKIIKDSMDVRVYLGPIIAIAVLFTVFGLFVIGSISDLYYEHMKEDAYEVSVAYSQNIIKSSHAYEVIEGLLEEKLMVAGGSVASSEQNFTHQGLSEIANLLKVSDIYIYNDNKTIISSSNNQYIGWQPESNHPVNLFIESNTESYVEEIRADTESGEHYMYGYHRLPGGGIVQVGIKADTIMSVLEAFEIETLISEMLISNEMRRISILDNDNIIRYSTEEGLINREIVESSIIGSIESDEIVGTESILLEEDVYEIYVPIYVHSDKVGTLVVSQSMEQTRAASSQIRIIGGMVILIVYALLGYTIRETLKKNRELTKVAYFDNTTGLLNHQYLTLVIENAIKENRSGALFRIKSTGLKVINMTYGPSYGDDVLYEVVTRLKDLQNDNKVLYRYTADEMFFFLDGFDTKNEIESLAKEIELTYSSPFIINGVEQYVSSHIGIVDIKGCISTDQVFKDSLIALGFNEDTEKSSHVMFDKSMLSKIEREDIIERELRKYINQNSERLFIVAQPIIDLKNKRISGFEILTRMNSETFGQVSPIEFIDVAERRHVIVPLSYYILDKACKFAKSLYDKGYDYLRVGINISGIHILRDDFVLKIFEVIKNNNVSRKMINLEITESILLDKYDVVNGKLAELQDQGITISLDDFGTGYSSLARLKSLSINKVKIDKEFIDGIENGEFLVEKIISLIHSFGYKVVAEGVESNKQLIYLENHDCDLIQGYVFSKPVLPKDAIELLKE